MAPAGVDPLLFWIGIVLIATAWWGILIFQWVGFRRVWNSIQRAWDRGGHHITEDQHRIEEDQVVTGVYRAARKMRRNRIVWMIIALIQTILTSYSVIYEDLLPASLPISSYFALIIQGFGALALAAANCYWTLKANELVAKYEILIPREIVK